MQTLNLLKKLKPFHSKLVCSKTLWERCCNCCSLTWVQRTDSDWTLCTRCCCCVWCLAARHSEEIKSTSVRTSLSSTLFYSCIERRCFGEGTISCLHCNTWTKFIMSLHLHTLISWDLESCCCSFFCSSSVFSRSRSCALVISILASARAGSKSCSRCSTSGGNCPSPVGGSATLWCRSLYEHLIFKTTYE